MSTVERLSGEIKLPPAPVLAVRLLAIVENDESSSQELATVIQADPALATKVLRHLNSDFSGRPGKASTIETAVASLGINAVKNVALSFVLSGTFKSDGGEFFDSERFWRRSITAAVACELICKAVHFKSEDTFITALLQDVGIAAIFTIKREEYVRVLDEKLITALPMATVEKRVFGFDHQEIGSELLKNWGLPETIYMPIFYHHDTYNVPRDLVAISSILRASDRISAIYHGPSSTKSVREAKEILNKSFGLNEERVNGLIDNVAQSSVEILSQFELEPGAIKPFSQVLNEANEELKRLNLSHEMLLLEYRQAKERAERLTAELKKVHGRLSDVASRDALTGLYNYKYFQEALEREVARGQRYKRHLGVLMVGIDHFKEINDRFGHQQGDIILRTIGEEITLRMRKSDLVARFGGDEFVLLLPETALSSAFATGEVCRSAVEKAIKMPGIDSPITISVGVASFDPSNPVDQEDLVRAADEALRRAKQAGRNCVSV